MYHSKRKIAFMFLVIITILLALSTYNIFYNLGSFSIYSWDEARHGISAYEMIRNRNYIVNTFQYENDYWNLKPPLSFWSIMLGYKLVGFNALGLRLISAICAMLTIIMVTLFVYIRHGRIASLLSLLTLSTCTQFLINHSSRTGDADSLFVFLFTLSILSLLLSEQSDRWLICAGISFSLAFLTKSWHAGNIAVIMCLYLLLTERYKKISSKLWMLLGISMFGPILIWMIVRFHYDGIEFLKTMIEYDLLKRSAGTIEGHVGSIFYYAQVLIRFFIFWLFLLVGLLVVCILNKSFSIKVFKHPYVIGLCLWVIIPLFLFTFSKTKIRWYITPIYPPLSIMIGILANKVWIQGKWVIRSTLLLTFLCISTYYEEKIHSFINEPRKNLQQHLLEKTRGMSEMKGYILYMYKPDKRIKWEQNILLTAELVNDYKVDDGDFYSFLSNEKAVLLTKREWVTNEFIQSHRLRIIQSNKWGYLLKKEEE